MSEQNPLHIHGGYQDFELTCEQGMLTLRPGPFLPNEALNYLSGYVHRFSGRKNILGSSGFSPCDFTPLTIGTYPEQSIKALWQALINSIPYKPLSKQCRMQDPQFRSTFIDTIPANAPLPYPILA